MSDDGCEAGRAVAIQYGTGVHDEVTEVRACEFILSPSRYKISIVAQNTVISSTHPRST